MPRWPITVLVVVEAVRRRRSLWRDLGTFACGVAIPITLALAHAATIGLGDWWFAVAGHRSQTDSVVHGPFRHRLELFRDSLGPFARSLGPLTVLAAGGVDRGAAGTAPHPPVWHGWQPRPRGSRSAGCTTRTTGCR